MRVHKLLEEACVELRIVLLVVQFVRCPRLEQLLDEVDDALLVLDVQVGIELRPQALRNAKYLVRSRLV